VKTAPVQAPSQFDFAPANQPLVGVIDTGFAGNNTDIDYERIILGQDRVDGDNNPLLAADEGNEHGTHVLGIIGATQNNGIGIDGINDDAPIWLGRAVGSGKWAESLVEFVDAAKVSGQPNAVVNLSLDLTQTNPDGSVTTRYEFTPQERAAIEYARQHNVMLVVAAGNDGGVMSALGQSSQEFDNIITVGAAERVNDEVALSKAYDRAEYSSYGNGLDIMAPVGDYELSTVGDSVGTMAGTSVATAKVTGAASQIWAANPQLSYRQVIEILKKTATDLAETGFDTATGAGLLNMVAAVQLAKATKPEDYDPAPFLIPTTWSGQGKVTVRERAVNSNSIYLSTDLGEIVQFDLGTGQKRHIYQGQAFTDLAVAPNGKLYGSTFNHLFEINTSTGEETYIGGFGGPNINSLTFSPDGRLYGAEDKSGDVFEISPQTARLTYIGNLGGPSSGDMVFNGASQFFATVGSPSMERDRLVAFDLNTRRARTITELSDDQFYGLAMHNGQLIGYTARNQEIALDPLTGQIKSISVVPVSGAIWGAAQNYNNVSYNPSPSSDWQEAMEREYQAMKGLLGNPTGPYATASRSPQGTEGIWRAYETGTIHWSSQYGAVALWHDLQREYNEHGGSGGWLGFPTQREHDWNGGKRTLFEGGYIYWDGQRAEAYRHGELPAPNWQQAMEQEYQAMKGLLGNPSGPYATAGRSPQGTTGKWRAYETGTIHWSSQYGAVALWHDLQREYNEHGGSGGWLGFPTKRERDWNGGKRTDFEGGFIYWDGQRATAYRNGEFVITKEHLDKFARVAARSPEIGAAKGPIEHRGNGFLFQPFESGHIEWNGQKFVVTIYGDGNPSVSQPINTPTQGPKIINQSGESGTGRLTAGTNFRTYPWVNDSTSPQLISAGTTFTLLEKVTTDDSTYPNWYKVRLNDGREGYFWANTVEKVGSNSGGSGGGSQAPILSQKGADYFKARPQFYTTGNIFSQSSYGSNLVDGYSYREGNCTWYAHGRVKELGGNPAALNSMYGNANQWHQQLSNGSQIVFSPQPGDIAQWTSNGQNHVAVVERVNGDGTITISESDYINNWDGGGAGSLHRVRTISASNPDHYIRVPGVSVGSGNSGGGSSGGSNVIIINRNITLEQSFNPNINSQFQPSFSIPNNSNWRFDEAVRYMFQQMKLNLDSKESQYMKRLIQGGSWPSFSKATAKWIEMVGPNKPWDHKSEKDGIPKLPTKLALKGTNYFFRFPDDFNYEYFYDIWSNIHYGYVGSAIGFTSQYLHTGASVVDIFSLGGVDLPDVEAVQIGIDLWNKKGQFLTENDLRDIVLKRREKLQRQPISAKGTLIP